jgi:hypothetical protein
MDDWLMVNQTLPSETGSESISLMLMSAIQSAKESPLDVYRS